MGYMQYIVFHVDGGAGKVVLSTSVAASIKQQYPEHKLIVVTSWPEVYLNNPNVYRVYNAASTPYFYEDYINGKDTKVFRIDPYHTDDFIQKNKHLINIWCDLYGIQSSGVSPSIHLTHMELDMMRSRIVSTKPILLVQTNGGAKGQSTPFSWARDLPINIAQTVVDKLRNDYQIIQIRREDQIALKNTEFFTGSLREIAALISMSQKRLFIDSFPQHVAAAFGKKSTVCWVSNKPNVFGYNIHDNIIPEIQPNFKHSIDSYLEEAEWTGSKLYECNYKLTDIFNPDRIIESLLRN